MPMSNMQLTCSLPRVCRILSLSFTQLRTKSSCVRKLFLNQGRVINFEDFLKKNYPYMHWHNQKYQVHVIANILVNCIWFILSPKFLIYEEVQNLLVTDIKTTDVSNYLSSHWLLLLSSSCKRNLTHKKMAIKLTKVVSMSLPWRLANK